MKHILSLKMLFFVKYFLLVFTVLRLATADEAVNPAELRHCYSCEGIDCQRTSRQNATASCNDELDYCVSIFQGYAVEARGCYGDLAPVHRQKCDDASNPECVKCFGQLCNVKARADLKCITCKSSKSSQCADDTSALTPEPCAIPTAPNSYCFVRDSPEEGVTRGCLVHQREQLECLADARCSMCLSADSMSTKACNAYKVQTWATAGSNSRAYAPVSCLLLAIALSRFIFRP